MLLNFPHGGPSIGSAGSDRPVADDAAGDDDDDGPGADGPAGGGLLDDFDEDDDDPPKLEGAPAPAVRTTPSSH